MRITEKIIRDWSGDPRGESLQCYVAKKIINQECRMLGCPECRQKVAEYLLTSYDTEAETECTAFEAEYLNKLMEMGYRWIFRYEDELAAYRYEPYWEEDSLITSETDRELLLDPSLFPFIEKGRLKPTSIKAILRNYGISMRKVKTK